ncbi:TetR/AcrR family transcriptional regulator C-terminal domain-containing protein [Streptomyces sp. NPDC057854]|uniref:TetR/AcrR family transcriptional regulator C-terminal domain-containing protein n=1 Tax=unclassified Streptomyces TaxID=2593676 RepID=UPI00369202B7
MTQITGVADGPPYRRIAADIRRRVADGELAPGDRIPSTRRIAEEWGVALATAAKALTILRLEGVVEAVPRVGTVIAGPTASPAHRRTTPPAPTTPGAAPPGTGARAAEPGTEQELSLDRIVRTAIGIADAEGLTGLSMRGVAARLGVAPMSTYRYVPSKEELVLHMADAAFGEESYPPDAPEGWRARVELGARTMWRLYRRHPWLAQLGSLSRPLLVPRLLVHGEWILSALDGHGLAPAELFDVHVLIYSHVQGLAVHLEREAHAEAATGQSEDQWMDGRAGELRALAESGRFPTFAKVVGGFEDGYDLDLDALFERGLAALLDGLTPLVEGGGR